MNSPWIIGGAAGCVALMTVVALLAFRDPRRAAIVMGVAATAWVTMITLLVIHLADR